MRNRLIVAGLAGVALLAAAAAADAQPRAGAPVVLRPQIATQQPGRETNVDASGRSAAEFKALNDAVQQLQAQVASLQAEVNALKGAHANLATEVNKAGQSAATKAWVQQGFVDIATFKSHKHGYDRTDVGWTNVPVIKTVGTLGGGSGEEKELVSYVYSKTWDPQVTTPPK